MTIQEAKQVLLLYRPHAVDSHDPETAEALLLARQDPELGRWFEEHCGFQKAVRQKLCQVPVPPQLKNRILQERKIVRPSWWQQPAWLAVAAAVVILTAVAPLLFTPDRPDKLADCRARLVRETLRSYQMQIMTNDLEQVRRFLGQQGAPADYRVPPSLNRMTVTGGGKLKWRGNPVSMVCFDKGGGHMLFLFVVSRSAVKEAPSPTRPEVKQVSTLGTASWTEGNNTYILAGEERPDELLRYLPPS